MIPPRDDDGLPDRLPDDLSNSTGVSDATYDLLATLTNKLDEIWHIDEFIDQDMDDPDRPVWARIRDHDADDVRHLLRALRRHLNQMEL
jgi:hypothetical protein